LRKISRDKFKFQ